MRLLLFNPETEYALASGASFYTPPAVVEAFRKDSQLLPLKYADADDVILVDSVSDFDDDSLRLVDWNSLDSFFERFPDAAVSPWGWNHALRRRLLDAGVPEVSLPSVEWVDNLRSLAHRRTTIALNEAWNRLMPSNPLPVPVQLFTEEECVAFWRRTPGCWMKAPWSSSGRGVINTAADMEERHIRPWCHGIIRRQGSVMGETPADKAADFATEWNLLNGEAIFLGLSYFETSRRGKYIRNMSASQSEIRDAFNSLCRLDLDFVIGKQKIILERVLDGYDGPCGVDMMVEKDGRLRPFVELNLRRTMGMLSL